MLVTSNPQYTTNSTPAQPVDLSVLRTLIALGKLADELEALSDSLHTVWKIVIEIDSQMALEISDLRSKLERHARNIRKHALYLIDHPEEFRK